MVFYYSIRGGPCRNGNSHIILDGQKDIICYVGRDKHENEYLIKYGWPGDIWFHVEGLSSAHVYFRIKNLHANTRIPVEGIPIDDCKSAYEFAVEMFGTIVIALCSSHLPLPFISPWY